MTAAATGNDVWLSLLAFIPFSALSLYSVYSSNRVILTRSLNIGRFEIILNGFLAPNNQILSPEDVAQREAFVRRTRSPFPHAIRLNTDLTMLCADHRSGDVHHGRGTTATQPELLRTCFRQTNFCQPERYFLYVDHSDRKGPITVHIWFEQSARAQDVLRGLFHAALVRRNLANDGDDQQNIDVSLKNVANAHAIVLAQYPALESGMRSAGWNVDDLLVEEHGGRVERYIDDEDKQSTS
jgi:hypothetical protein